MDVEKCMFATLAHARHGVDQSVADFLSDKHSKSPFKDRLPSYKIYEIVVACSNSVDLNAIERAINDALAKTFSLVDTDVTLDESFPASNFKFSKIEEVKAAGDVNNVAPPQRQIKSKHHYRYFHNVKLGITLLVERSYRHDKREEQSRFTG